MALLVVILTSTFTKKEDKVDYQSASVNVTTEEYSQVQSGDYESENSDDSHFYGTYANNLLHAEGGGKMDLKFINI
jgi:hypothetical protein